jgi:tetratricopeptide (TPR) repeat protein
MRLQLVSKILAGIALAPVVAAGQGHWVAPRCDLKPGHYMIKSAMLYLKNAADTRFDDQREKDLGDTQRTLTQALTSGGQDKNPAAWYYLGRYYVVRNDVPGADSAFRKAETLMPACHDDIELWRRNALWVPAFNAGVTALNAQNYDSAIASFRRAIMIYDGEPQTYTTLATTYFNAGQPDSAATFFHLAVEAFSAPKDSTAKKEATFNLGNAFYVAHQYDSAVAAYADYLRAAPNDPYALTRLGDVLAASGHLDSAMSVYRQIIAHPDSVDPVSLINTGVSVYNAAPPWPDTAGISTSCRTERQGGRTLTVVQRRRITVGCDSVARQAMTERNAAARTNYQLAAQAFEASLQHAPQSRDGLYNLSNSYMALRDSAKMLEMAQRLVALDPMSRSALRLVAQAWQIRGNSDSALHYVILADSLLPVEVSISSFIPRDSSATIGGLVSNYHEQPSTPHRVAFEFLNSDGSVLGTETIEVPALDAGGTHPFQVRASGTGIIAWRYHKE